MTNEIQLNISHCENSNLGHCANFRHEIQDEASHKYSGLNQKSVLVKCVLVPIFGAWRSTSADIFLISAMKRFEHIPSYMCR